MTDQMNAQTNAQTNAEQKKRKAFFDGVKPNATKLADKFIGYSPLNEKVKRLRELGRMPS